MMEEGEVTQMRQLDNCRGLGARSSQASHLNWKLEMEELQLETWEKFVVGKNPMEGESFHLKGRKDYWL